MNSRPDAKPYLDNVHLYKPGKSKTPAGTKAEKLSANENPLGCSPAAREAMQQALEHPHLYPTDGAPRLRQVIAKHYGLDAERVICGAGSDNILQMAANAFVRAEDIVVRTEFGFAVYDLLVRQHNAHARIVPDRNYVADIEGLIKAAAGARIIFLANPNNPTGTWLDKESLSHLHSQISQETLLVLDAAYSEYVTDEAYSAGLELAHNCENVLVTHTLSKIHGLAGLRVGWGYGASSLIGALNRVRIPFNVSAIAEAAACAAIQDKQHIAKSQAHNNQWRHWLHDQLVALGYTVVPSGANFLLFLVPENFAMSAAQTDTYLTSKGIIVRQVEDYGLPNALRVSVGTEKQNTAFIAALTEFIRS